MYLGQSLSFRESAVGEMLDCIERAKLDMRSTRGHGSGTQIKKLELLVVMNGPEHPLGLTALHDKDRSGFSSECFAKNP